MTKEEENKIFYELQKHVDELVKKQLQPAKSPVDVIIENTGFSKQFVTYILESVSLHYKNVEYLQHMVQFVAAECHRQHFDIDPKFDEIPARSIKQMAQICSKLKEDIAFSINDAEFTDEFPILTRFAIVATYCASYNPPITDRRFFFMGKDLLSKRKGKFGSSKKLQEKCHEIGPRPFEHQRAMFIFLYFCKTFDESLGDMNKYELRVDFASQITHLIANGFLRLVSARENFDSPMYLSLCSLNFVKNVASSISKEFNLEREYLFDFAEN